MGIIRLGAGPYAAGDLVAISYMCGYGGESAATIERPATNTAFEVTAQKKQIPR